MLGKVIRKLRRERDMTLRDVALHLGVSESGVSKMESGRVRLTEETITSLAELFGMSPVDLFSLAYGPSRLGDAVLLLIYELEKMQPGFSIAFRSVAENIEDLPEEDKTAIARVLKFHLDEARGKIPTPPGEDITNKI